MSAEVSGDGRYLLISVQHGWPKGELYFKNLADDSPIRPLIHNVEARFQTEIAGAHLIVSTNWKAPKGRVLSIDLSHPEPEAWREIVPEAGDAIQSITLAADQLYVNYLHNVATRIRSFSLDGKPLGDVALPGLGSAHLSGRWGSPAAFLSFQSFTTPATVWRYDPATGKRDLWFRPAVPVKPEQFEVKQVWYTSRDGTRAPMFLVHRKGVKPDGKRPVLLHGYGGFNVSLTPAFNAMAAVWAESGGVYALATLRGGGEFGEEWRRAGMLENKQNVFDDFIAAAEWLIANQYTSPSKLAILGASNGGLLVGAALTQRPDLYRAVLCLAPDLDMVRYDQFKNNNPPALLEYGNAADPAQFKFLHAYSPYQRVKPGTKYPAVLLSSGDMDTRVPPLQARKMAARLQAATASGRPVLLRYDTKFGHAGGRPFQKVVEDTAFELAFLFWQLEVDTK